MKKIKRKPLPKRIELTQQQLDTLLARVQSAMEKEDYETIRAMAETIAFLSQAVEEKGVSIKRLLRMLFGAGTEKTQKVLREALKENPQAEQPLSDPQASPKQEKKQRKGHGRNGASQYSGAVKLQVPHESLRSGDRCPECEKGKVYGLPTPGTVVRVVGQAPLQARVYELEKLRCNLCGEVFTAEPPPEARGEKYDEAAGSMIALLKYGSGVPFNRLEQLQGSLGIPLPASTQWEIVEGVANGISPVFEELGRQGAQGDLLHNDDTAMKILDLMKENAEKGEPEGQETAKRTGLFTSAIISKFEGHQIALFSTGREHAGESLGEVLAHREPGRGPPIQMCDALSRNVPKPFKVILANCIAHGRRKFVDVADNFPQECRYVLETLAEVYKHDASCKAQNLSPAQRLQFHQAHSGPLMEELHEWLGAQFEQKLVEPNSGLGQAISYMLNHWTPLTLFLRKAGAPLDNNICERALKKAILHRKASLFYKTEHGASVGDLFMSLIHTCKLNGANPFDYLTELQKHSAQVRRNPKAWMPWNYQDALTPRDPPETN